MKKTLFLFLFFTALSCTKEPSTISLESMNTDRLLFKDFKEFTETSFNLSKKSSMFDLQFWAQERNHSTLLFDTASVLSNYPPSLKTLFNKDAEIQIADSIIWLDINSGNLYTFAKKSSDIEDIKANPESYHRSGFFTSLGVKNSSKGDVPRDTYGPCEITGPWQQYYYQPCNESLVSANGTRKWVSELRDITGFYNGQWQSSLYLVIKLEWYSSRTGWHEASEPRDVNWSLYTPNGTVAYYMNYDLIDNVGWTTPTGNYTCLNNGAVQYNLWVPEAAIFGYAMGTNPHWVVNVSGSIYQHVIGNYTANMDPKTIYVQW